MSTTETPKQPFWRDAASILLTLLGLALIALSVVWPTVSSGRHGWTDQKARAYQAASADVHRLSMQAAGTESENQTRKLQNDLADAQTRYVELRMELDSARDKPARVATVLRYAGILLLAGGVIGLLTKRSAADTG